MDIQFVNGRPSQVKNYNGYSITLTERNGPRTGLLFTEGNGEALYSTFETRRQKYNEENGYVHSGYVDCKSLKAFKRHLRKYCSHLKDVEIHWHNEDPAQDRVLYL